MGESAGVTGGVARGARGLVQPVGAEEGQEEGANGGNGDQEDEHEEEAGERGPLPRLRRAPAQPDQDEVDQHNASGHIPRRLWCPACVRASLEEDPHRHAGVDHRDEGLPLVCLDYKELSKDQPPHLVMRVRGTGATYGVRCSRKGPEDQWLVERLVSKLEAWGMQDIHLWVKSDGEPAIVALQRAIRDRRASATHLMNSPPQDPQGNGVAERAVKEFLGTLRRLKLALESRLATRIPADHPIVQWMGEHASCAINWFLVGSQDGMTAHRRMFDKEFSGKLIEFGELVWAKPRTPPRPTRGRLTALDARCVQAVWVGVHEPTGENLVVLAGARGAAFRCRTVARMPVD